MTWRTRLDWGDSKSRETRSPRSRARGTVAARSGGTAVAVSKLRIYCEGFQGGPRGRHVLLPDTRAPCPQVPSSRAHPGAHPHRPGWGAHTVTACTHSSTAVSKAGLFTPASPQACEEHAAPRRAERAECFSPVGPLSCARSVADRNTVLGPTTVLSA